MGPKLGTGLEELAKSGTGALVPISGSSLSVMAAESHAQSNFLPKMVALVVQTYAHGVNAICNMKPGESKRDYIRENFVSIESVDTDHSKYKPLMDAVNQIFIAKNKLLHIHAFPSSYYFITKTEFNNFLEKVESSELKEWKQNLDELTKIGKEDKTNDPLSDLPAFVAEFNKDQSSNKIVYREKALHALDELRQQVWYKGKSKVDKPHSKSISAVRTAVFELYKCNSPEVKERSLTLLIEILDSDPIKPKSALDLVDLQQTLLEYIKAMKAQNLYTILLRLLMKSYAKSLECILLHQASRHLNALTEETKIAIWQGAVAVKNMNTNKDSEIQYLTWYAIQAAQHIKSDRSEVSKWLERVGCVVKAGVRIIAAGWGDASLAPENLEGAVDELKKAVANIEWHQKSFQELLIIIKLFRYSVISVEMFRGLVTTLQSKLTHDGEDNFFYGIVTALEQAAMTSKIPEVQEESLKALIQYLQMDNKKIQMRVLFSFTQMLNIKNRVGNTAHVIVKLLHACGRFDEYKEDPLFENVGQLERNVSFHLAKINKDGIREDLRDTYFVNVLKFLLRRLAFIRDDGEGQSLVTTLVHSNSVRLLPPLLTCLREYGKDLIIPDYHGKTPYHIAAEKGNPAMIQCFHENIPGNLNAQEYTFGRTPLHLAVLAGSLTTVTTLLELGADPGILDNEGNTPLHIAVDMEEKLIAKYLVDRMKDRNQVNIHGQAPLNIAIEGDSVELTEVLTNGKAKIAEHRHKTTPISLAAKSGSQRVLEYFLTFSHVSLAPHEALEIIRLISDDGKIIKCDRQFLEFHIKLMYSSKHYRGLFNMFPQWDVIAKSIEPLLNPITEQKSVPLPIKDKVRSPLHQRAKSVPSDKALAFYTEPGNNILIKCAQKSSVFDNAELPNINKMNWMGITPVSAAVICRNEESFKRLLDLRADLNIAEVRGFTPLHFAVIFFHPETLLPIIKAENRTIDPKNDWGDTPFLIACGLSPLRKPESVRSVTSESVPEFVDSKKTVAVIKALAKAGANQTETDFLGNNALHHAFAWGGPFVIGYLIRHLPELFWKPNAVGKLPIEEAIAKGNNKIVKAYFENLSDKELLTLHHDFIEKTKNVITLPSLLVKVGAFSSFERLYKLDPSCAAKPDSTPLKLTPLHYAATLRDLNFIRFYLDNGIALDLKDSYGQTAAHIFVEIGFVEGVELLAKRPMLWNNTNLWNKTNRDLRTPLHIAAIKGYVDIIKRILVIPGVSVGPDGHGDFPLHHASKHGHKDASEVLCRVHHDFEELRNDEGYTPGHLAAAGGHVETFDCLLTCVEKLSMPQEQKTLEEVIEKRKSRIIEARNNFGITPLMLAGLHGQVPMFRRLLHLNADIYAIEQDGKTVLHMSTRNSRFQILEILMELEKNLIRPEVGRLVHMADASGEIPLFKLAKTKAISSPAEEEEDKKCLFLLLKEGSNIETKNTLGETFTHLICFHGHIHLLTALSKHYGSFKLIPTMLEKDNHKNTPVHKACNGNHIDMVRTLIEQYHAGYKSENEHGYTPTLVAVRLGFCELSQYLINRKGNASDRDSEGKNVLHLLAERPHLTSEQKRFFAYLLVAYPELAYDRDKHGRSILHSLAEYDHKDLITVTLHNLGGDQKRMEEFVSSENKDRKSALTTSKEKGFKQFAITLQGFPKNELGSKLKESRTNLRKAKDT